MRVFILFILLLNSSPLIAQEKQPVHDKQLNHLIAGIQFHSGTDQLDNDYSDQLKVMAFIIKNAGGYKFQIRSHTDNVGSKESNMKLSIARAYLIVKKLIDLGVNPEMIEGKGMGESEPIASNKTNEGRSQNRRLEVIRID